MTLEQQDVVTPPIPIKVTVFIQRVTFKILFFNLILNVITVIA